MLTSSIMSRGKRREDLYDRLYSLRWGEATTNNYGFAPAESTEPERFQLQLYTELLKLLESTAGATGIERVLEISCGRGGGLRHLALRLPGAKQLIGLDVSMHAIRFCRTRYAGLPSLAFVRGHALRLPFPDGSFDLVINVEASHAYRDDATLLREVRRVLRAPGRFFYADHRTRRKMPRLEQMARAAGFTGPLHDVTPNVVRSCELDCERRRALIRSDCLGGPARSAAVGSSATRGFREPRPSSGCAVATGCISSPAWPWCRAGSVSSPLRPPAAPPEPAQPTSHARLSRRVAPRISGSSVNQEASGHGDDRPSDAAR